MRKKGLWITIALLVALILAPTVAAQAASTEETLNEFYEVLAQALATGDATDFLEFFTEDATVSVPALSPAPVEGKELIEAAMWPGIFGAVGGSTIEVLLIDADGNTATTYITYVEAGYPAQEIFEMEDGKIKSWTVNVGVTAPEAAAEEAATTEEETATTEGEPATLPESGGVTVNLLPGLLMLGGATLAVLGRKLKAQ